MPSSAPATPPLSTLSLHDALPISTLTGLLRSELGFDGPVVTDDLRMGAIEQRWGLETAAVTALAAGADILLIANDRLPDGGSAARRSEERRVGTGCRAE